MNRRAFNQSTSLLSRPSWVIIFVFTVVALASQISTHRLGAVLVAEAQPRMAHHEAYLLPQPEVLRVIGFGHDELMADLIWLRGLSYFAIHFYLDQNYQWLDRYIETVIELDPDFKLIYHWAGVVVMYGGQEIDNSSVMASNRFLELGRQRYPNDWLINLMLGTNYRYELTPENERQAREWRLLGATYLKRAADLPEAPAWLALTALRSLERYGEGEEAISVAISSFLNQRGVFSATNRAELMLHRHNPEYASSGLLNLGSLVANGLRLRHQLPSTEWWSLLNRRRLLFADLDSVSGYMPWELRVLTRRGPETRSRATSTPLDVAFYPTLELIRHVPDFE